MVLMKGTAFMIYLVLIEDHRKDPDYQSYARYVLKELLLCDKIKAVHMHLDEMHAALMCALSSPGV